MFNPWILLGITLAWVSSIAGTAIYFRSQGIDSERVVWQAKQADDTARFNALLIQTQGKYRALENKRAEDAANRDLEAKKQLKEVSNVKDRIIADLRSNVISLRDPYANTKACSGGLPKTSTSELPEAGNELSKEFAEFLINEAYRADGIVIQLNSCIDQLHADRE